MTLFRSGKRDMLANCLGNPLSTVVLKTAFGTPGLVCLNYHRIATEVEHDDDNIAATPSQLEWQARWLASSGLSVWGGSEIVKLLNSGRAIDRPTVTLTFDDGYEDNFEAGKMLMEKYRIPAIFFIPTGFIETGVVPPWDRMAYALKHSSTDTLEIGPIGHLPPVRVNRHAGSLAGSTLMQMYYRLPQAQRADLVEAVETAARAAAGRSERPLFMNWDQIRALQQMGHMIGAHTVTHPVLSTLSTDEQREEVTASRHVLEARLGAPVPLFAYPFGKRSTTYDAVTQEVVAQAGYAGAFTNEGGWNRVDCIEPFALRRMSVDRAMTRSRFRARVLSRGRIPV